MKRINLVGWLIILLSLFSCSTSKKLNNLNKYNISLKSNFTNEVKSKFSADSIINNIKEDTVKVKIDGKDMILMSAVNVNGEMIAHDYIKAAVVTSRFRNIAERNGYVDIIFQIKVPVGMMDTDWQTRFYPKMKYLDKTIDLDPVYVTGVNYRKAQLRGYERYDNFIRSIITDTTKLINMFQLELFLKRNIPQIYKYKYENNFVTEEEFYSHYGVTEKQAIEHYTWRLLVKRNKWKIARKKKMFQKYVKVPIVKTTKIDTVYNGKQELVYNYVQPVKTVKGMKKVEIIIGGEIYKDENKIYDIPITEPLTFYISSLSNLTDNAIRYKTKIVYRKASVKASYMINFKSGNVDLLESLGSNKKELRKIDSTFNYLYDNKEFILDTILISSFASPEGSSLLNKKLSINRGNTMNNYADKKLRYLISKKEDGFNIDENGNIYKEQKQVNNVKIITNIGGENWGLFTKLLEKDDNVNEIDKSFYYRSLNILNEDLRENFLKNNHNFYKYCKENYYPILRNVDFEFKLHRKNMVKDTIHTTVVDTTYMLGLQAITDKDYDMALNYLIPYQDYNTAVVYVALDRNQSALSILSNMKKTAQVNYLLALVYSRIGEIQKAVQSYMEACKEDSTYINRGNLDPEISAIIKKYGLNQDKE